MSTPNNYIKGHELHMKVHMKDGVVPLRVNKVLKLSYVFDSVTFFEPNSDQEVRNMTYNDK